MKKSLSSVAQGLLAETAACEFLQSQGLRLATANFRSKYGEIDLIMKEQELYIFVEVRYRKNGDFGKGIETVSHYKRARIIRTALQYLQQERLLDKVFCRFDVIGVGLDVHDQHTKFWWIKNAFEVNYS